MLPGEQGYRGPVGPEIEAFTAHDTDAKSGRTVGRFSLHFPSARRSAVRDETQRAGTPGIAEAAGGLFLLVMADDRDQVGIGGTRGEPLVRL